ncbi:MAG TPA: hypothetical protein VF786_09605, partial [Terriglobales bacterium]
AVPSPVGTTEHKRHMEADWSVELAADDPVLEMPWASPDGMLQWHDLRRHPELIPELPECEAYPELMEPLCALSSRDSRMITAKCDAFPPEPAEPAEELYGSWRMVSYIDLLFADPLTASGHADHGFAPTASNFAFALHEQFAKGLCARVNDDSDGAELNATVELVIRRCVYTNSHVSDSRDGFYFTLYVVGYGESAASAREKWSAALRASSKLLLQVPCAAQGGSQ